MAAIAITQAKQVDKVGPGSYTVAPNLILRVKPTGARSWVFRYQSGGKPVEIGLGKAGANGRSRDEAIEKAELMRRDVVEGRNPKLRVNAKFNAGAATFNDYAKIVIDKKDQECRNGKHLKQWQSTIDEYCSGKHRGVPNIAAMQPKEITYLDVEAVLKQKALRNDDGTPKAETQSRLRQRMRAILKQAAIAEGEPHRFNPAEFYELPKRKRGGITNHHPAAQWQDCPAIYAALVAKGLNKATGEIDLSKEPTSSLVLRWSILTAARSGEARGTLWAEIEEAEWNLPPERMKMHRQHIVPLCDDALAILETMKERIHPRAKERVFPGAQGGLISDVAVNKTLAAAAKDAGIEYKVTAHGFRSSFRDWVAEATEFPGQAAEWALAHSPTNKVEGAYQRASLLDKRKAIMTAWNLYLKGEEPADSNVVEFPGAKVA
ncbi:MAG: tyrosine-type recombinase/integrase [Sphingopyxis sp.]|nr:tyrosine-type recombinase/integrase [Sphingopyxis sp.]